MYGKEPPLEPDQNLDLEDSKQERIQSLEQVITDTRDYLESVLENYKESDKLVDKIQSAVDMLEL